MKKYLRWAVTVICVLAAGVCYSCGGMNGRGEAFAERTLILDAEDPDGADASGRFPGAGTVPGQTGAGGLAEADAVPGQTGAVGSAEAGAVPGQTGAVGSAEAGAAYADASDPKAAAGVPAETGAYSGEQAEEALCYVHICGEVARPGVYELPEGSRIFEAVEMAGGFTQEAASSYLNLAQEIADGMKIVVPSKAQLAAEAEDVSEDAPNGAESTGAQADGTGEASGALRDGEGAGTYTGGYGVFAGNDAVYTGGYGIFSGSGGAAVAAAPSDGKVNINTAGKEELMTLKGIGEARAEDIIRYREENGPFHTIEDIMKVSGIKNAAFEKIKDDITV